MFSSRQQRQHPSPLMTRGTKMTVVKMASALCVWIQCHAWMRGARDGTDFKGLNNSWIFSTTSPPSGYSTITEVTLMIFSKPFPLRYNRFPHTNPEETCLLVISTWKPLEKNHSSPLKFLFLLIPCEKHLGLEEPSHLCVELSILPSTAVLSLHHWGTHYSASVQDTFSGVAKMPVDCIIWWRCKVRTGRGED